MTKAVSDRFGKGGIADRMIWFNGFPFLDNKEEHTFGVPVSQVMTTNVTCLPASGLELQDVEKIMAENNFQGYPIIEDTGSRTLLGYVGRTELRYALDRARRDQLASTHAKCYFSSSAGRMTPTTPRSVAAAAASFDTMGPTAGQMSVDLSRFIDPTPLSVHPRLALETVMELFKKMGPRVILIEYRGKLTGLVTVKDCLKYQFKVEAQENPKDDSAIEEGQERVWDIMKRCTSWVMQKLLGPRERGVRLSDSQPLDGSLNNAPVSPVATRDGIRRSETTGVELEDR